MVRTTGIIKRQKISTRRQLKIVVLIYKGKPIQLTLLSKLQFEEDKMKRFGLMKTKRITERKKLNCFLQWTTSTMERCWREDPLDFVTVEGLRVAQRQILYGDLLKSDLKSLSGQLSFVLIVVCDSQR